MNKRFKRHRDLGLFDQDIRLSKLTKLGDPLDKLNNCVDFEIFRAFLEDNLYKLQNGKGGRPPYDYVLLFKILILQRFYNLSDDRTEFQINDRLSFMRFLNLTISDDIPDSKTIWKFRERLVDLQLVEPLFDLFLQSLERLNLVVHDGKIIDASFVEVPRQRNSREDNATIKSGKIPENFKENPHKLAQKDTQARWTKKHNQTYFGYKNHVKIDGQSKLITKYKVTDASVHDSQVLGDLLDSSDHGQNFYADSAYTGKEQESIISKKNMKNCVIEKGYKNKPLTDEQKSANKENSIVRVRVEHVYAWLENSKHGMNHKYIGIKRACATVGLDNLIYNMFRKSYLIG